MIRGASWASTKTATHFRPTKSTKPAKTLYQRRLRDYAAEFDEFVRRRVAMLAEIDAIKKDIEQLTAAQEVAKKLQASRTEERAKLTADLAGVTKEREAIEKHLAEVEKLLAKARQLTAEMLEKNRKLTAELTARQLPSRPSDGGNGSTAKSAEPLALGARVASRSAELRRTSFGVPLGSRQLPISDAI